MTALPGTSPQTVHVDRPVASRALVTAAGTAFVIAGALVVRGRAPSEVALAAAFGGVLAALARTDLDRRVTPNRIIYPALVLAVVLCGAWPDRGLTETLAGGVGAFAFFVTLRLVNESAVGGGDIKMAALAGAVVGSPGVLSAALVTAIVGGATGLTLVTARRASRQDRLPYGPFLALGAVAALLR